MLNTDTHAALMAVRKKSAAKKAKVKDALLAKVEAAKTVADLKEILKEVLRG